MRFLAHIMSRSEKTLLRMGLLQTFLVVTLLFSFPYKIFATESDRSVRDEEVVRRAAESICLKGYGVGYFKSPDGRYCCNCKKGEYLLDFCEENHKGKPQSRVCKPCFFNADNPDEQTWMDIESNSTRCKQAIPGNYCSQFLNARRESGSEIEDGRCVCIDGYHLANQTANNVVGGCQRNSPCPEGYQPYSASNGKHDTLCETCPKGFFSNLSSVTDVCMPWTRCNEQEYVFVESNRTHDRVCKTDQPTNLTETKVPSTLSAGIIAGIVVGAILLAVFSMLLIYLCAFKRKICSHFCKTYKNCPQPERGQVVTNIEHGPESGDRNEQEGLETGQQDNVETTNELEETSLMQNKSYIDMHGDGREAEVAVDKSVSKPCLAQSSVYTDSLPPLDKQPYCNLFSGFDEELCSAQEHGCCNCCLERQLDDHEVAKQMMKSLENHDTDELRKFLKMIGLTDQQDQDLDEENRKREIYRSRMIAQVLKSHGRELKPRCILDKEIAGNAIRDKMLLKFFEGLRPCH